jgi:hypothetical protein
MPLQFNKLKHFYKEDQIVVHGDNTQILFNHKENDGAVVLYTPKKYKDEDKNIALTLKVSNSQLEHFIKFEAFIQEVAEKYVPGLSFHSNLNTIDNTVRVKINDETIIKGLTPSGNLVDLKWVDIPRESVVSAVGKISSRLWQMNLHNVDTVGYSIILKELVVVLPKNGRPLPRVEEISIISAFQKKEHKQIKKLKLMDFDEHLKLKGSN